MLYVNLNKNVLFSFFAIIIVLFSACTKEDKARKKISGSYTFYHYEVDYYDVDGLTITSSTLKDLSGTIVLNTNNGNESDWYNDCEYSLTEIPLGWVDNGIITQYPSWNVDQGSMKVINFFIEPNPGNVTYATYTIQKNGYKKYIFSYVKMDGTGKLLFQERLYLKKQ